MNLDLIKGDLRNKIGRNVQIYVHGLRNKNVKFVGKIYNLYPNIFSIMTDIGEKSFSYNDLATGEVTIKYL